jgi:hypothetical protein
MQAPRELLRALLRSALESRTHRRVALAGKAEALLAVRRPMTDAPPRAANRAVRVLSAHEGAPPARASIQ